MNAFILAGLGRISINHKKNEKKEKDQGKNVSINILRPHQKTFIFNKYRT